MNLIHVTRKFNEAVVQAEIANSLYKEDRENRPVSPCPSAVRPVPPRVKNPNGNRKIMKRKPILGETLFDLNIGNAARRGIPQILTPVTVKTVGRKYFTCAPSEGQYRPETTYKIESWEQKTEFCRDHKLYETVQEWEDERESAAIRAEIRAKFSHYGECDVPLELLRAIKSLLANAGSDAPGAIEKP